MQLLRGDGKWQLRSAFSVNGLYYHFLHDTHILYPILINTFGWPPHKQQGLRLLWRRHNLGVHRSRLAVKSFVTTTTLRSPMRDRGSDKTRLKSSTLWSTPTFNRHPSRYINQVIVALMWLESFSASQVINALMLYKAFVASHFIRAQMRTHILVAQQCLLTMSSSSVCISEKRSKFAQTVGSKIPLPPNSEVDSSGQTDVPRKEIFFAHTKSRETQ